jgi:hypothetical protein
MSSKATAAVKPIAPKVSEPVAPSAVDLVGIMRAALKIAALEETVLALAPARARSQQAAARKLFKPGRLPGLQARRERVDSSAGSHQVLRELLNQQYAALMLEVQPAGSLLDAGATARSVQAAIDATPVARPDPLRVKLEQRAIDAVLGGAPWLTSQEVGLKANPAAANPHAVASRWLKEGKVFAIERAGQKLFPSYAFDPLGVPHAAVKTVSTLLAGYTPFRLAAWFESTSAALAGARPRELLAQDPQAVIAAASAHAQGPLHG